MERTTAPGCTQDNKYTDGDANTEPTELNAAAQNAIQEELCSIVEGMGITLQPGIYNQVLQAILAIVSGGGSGPAAVGTNQIINGEFAIFQRASSAPGGILTKVYGAGTTSYGLDRWEYSTDAAGGAGVATVSQQPFTPGQTNVPGNPLWFARFAQTINATVAQPFLRTKIEEVTRYGGGPLCYSFYAQATAPLAVTIRILQRFGTGGSADVVVATVPATIGTSFTRFQAPIASVPNTNGKTVGAGNHLLLEIDLPTGQSFQLDVADAQLERNSAPTAIARRSSAVELELARRYFEKSWGALVAAATCPASLDGASVSQWGGTIGPIQELVRRFRTEKRAAPTMTWFDPPSQQAGRVRTPGGAMVVSAVTDAGASSTGYPTVTGAANGPGLVEAHWTADAEL